MRAAALPNGQYIRSDESRKEFIPLLGQWSPREESNPQPPDYKSGALPLRHSGMRLVQYTIPLL